MHTQKGVSLLEIIVVMVIASVIVGMGAPKVAAALRQRSVTSAADQFLLAHSFARSTGIRYGRVAQLHIDASTARVWVDVDTSANGVGQRATIANIRYVSDAGLQMASNRSLLCFDGRGIASTAGSCESGDANVIFSDGVVADTVSTTILGKVLR